MTANAMTAHGPTAQHPGAGKRRDVDDGVERAGTGVQGRREGARHDVGEVSERLHQEEQHAGEEEAEQHVEQQLFVRPLGAACGCAELDGRSGIEQVVEVERDPLEAGVDVTFVHRRSTGHGAGQVRSTTPVSAESRS
jgi:hypothetical protein